MIFLNVSNHPSDKWSEEQRRAALALVQSPTADEAAQLDDWAMIVDVPFPNVDPNLGEAEIVGLAQKTLSAAEQAVADALLARPDLLSEFSTPAMMPARWLAMVMGEQCLAYHLTRLLEAAGVAVVAATTERVAVEKDGVKTSVFKFVRFRRIDRNAGDGVVVADTFRNCVGQLLERHKEAVLTEEAQRIAGRLVAQYVTPNLRHIDWGKPTWLYKWTCPECGWTIHHRAYLPSVSFGSMPSDKPSGGNFTVREEGQASQLGLVATAAVGHMMSRCGYKTVKDCLEWAKSRLPKRQFVALWNETWIKPDGQ